MLAKGARLGALVAGVLVFSATVADAQAATKLGSFHGWSAYSAGSGDGAICFAVAKADDVSPPPDGYTQAYIYLTHRPSEGVNAELNVVAGFALAPDQPGALSVDGHAYTLFSKDDSAWLKDPTQNDNLAGIMRAGSSVIVDLVSAKGQKVRETFSLAGATAATKVIGTGC
jgi:hypothetical protein